MKQIIPFILLLSTSCRFVALDLKSTHFATKEKISHDWTTVEYTSSESIKVKIKKSILPFIKSKIVVKDSINQSYIVLSRKIDLKSSDGKEMMELTCKDNNKSNCKIYFINRDSNSQIVDLIVNYENKNFYYTLVEDNED